MKVLTRAVALVAILNLIVPAGLHAADATVETSTTTAPVSPKRHHHMKKISASIASSGTPVATEGTGSNRKTAAPNTDAPGMSDSLGTNNPGSPNMGSADHTPGTTGTSGQ